MATGDGGLPLTALMVLSPSTSVRAAAVTFLGLESLQHVCEWQMTSPRQSINQICVNLVAINDEAAILAHETPLLLTGVMKVMISLKEMFQSNLTCVISFCLAHPEHSVEYSL